MVEVGAFGGSLCPNYQLWVYVVRIADDLRRCSTGKGCDFQTCHFMVHNITVTGTSVFMWVTILTYLAYRTNRHLSVHVGYNTNLSSI